VKSTIMVLILVLTTAVFSQSNIGYVDMPAIEKGYSAMAKYKTEQDKIIKRYEDLGKKLQEEYVKLGQDFQSQKLLLTQAKQQEKIGEIQRKEQEIKQFQQKNLVPQTGEMYRKINEAQKPYLDKILAAITTVAKEKGLDLMLNNAQGIVLYTSEKIDFSKDVITILNKK
jgi:outer membrane protein